MPSGFKIEVAGAVGSARELAALPNGDLLVATNGNTIAIIPNAEADGVPGKSSTFAAAPDANPAGITYVPTTCAVYLGTNKGIYKLTYADAQLTGTFGAAIANVRTGSVTPNSDGDVHKTTSVAFSNRQVYASVGSGCNACTEVDPTRASIQVMDADGTNMTTRATQIRNAIAITTNPATGTVWAGGAGQDDICDNHPTLCPNGSGHPYEFFDAVTSHSGVANYGWPSCEENHNPFGSGADCSGAVAPLISFLRIRRSSAQRVLRNANRLACVSFELPRRRVHRRSRLVALVCGRKLFRVTARRIRGDERRRARHARRLERSDQTVDDVHRRFPRSGFDDASRAPDRHGGWLEG